LAKLLTENETERERERVGEKEREKVQKICLDLFTSFQYL